MAMNDRDLTADSAFFLRSLIICFSHSFERDMLIKCVGKMTDKSNPFTVLEDVYKSNYSSKGGKRWRSWLRHCATSQKVAGSIPDGVVGIFY